MKPNIKEVIKVGVCLMIFVVVDILLVAMLNSSAGKWLFVKPPEMLSDSWASITTALPLVCVAIAFAGYLVWRLLFLIPSVILFAGRFARRWVFIVMIITVLCEGSVILYYYVVYGVIFTNLVQYGAPTFIYYAAPLWFAILVIAVLLFGSSHITNLPKILLKAKKIKEED
jgi:hypothetical protein